MSSSSRTEAGKAHLVLADLALAARSGPVGAPTILAYVARLQRQLAILAGYEEMADELANEALSMARARQAGIEAGIVLAFPARPRLHTGHGGNAA